MAMEKPRSNLRFALMPTLTAGIGLLVLLAVGAVMVVHWIVDRDVVQDFATALVMRVLSAEEAAARRHLDAAVHQGDFIAASHQRRPLQAWPIRRSRILSAVHSPPRPRSMRWWWAMPTETCCGWFVCRRAAGAQVDRISIRDDSQLGRLRKRSFAAAKSRIGDRRSTAKRAAKPS